MVASIADKLPAKNYRFGQAYGLDGVALRLESPVAVTPEMIRQNGILPFIDPLPRFAASQPSNLLRIFERGGEKQLPLGNPDPFDEPGKPARRLSEPPAFGVAAFRYVPGPFGPVSFCRACVEE